MKFTIDVKGLDLSLEAANKLAESVRPQVMDLWTKTIETTAKRLCDDKSNSIELKHTLDHKMIVGYRDRKSQDCLTNAIETHLNSMPPLVQGIYRKLAEDIRDGKFNQ